MAMILHLGEVLLAFIFVAGGVSTLRDPQPRASQIARFRLPFPRLSVRVNAVLMIVAGIALALNMYAALAASVLLAVLVPTTILGHAFWLEQGEQRQGQLGHFVKNVALMGGLLLATLAAS